MIFDFFWTAQAYLSIKVSHCFEKLCVPSHQNIRESDSLSRKPPLFASPGGTVYAPYPFLLCAHLLRFQSIPPCRLLSLSIVPITYSAQSPPPPRLQEWTPTPPTPREGWLTGLQFFNYQTHNRSVEEKKIFFFPHRKLTKRRRKLEGWKERTLYSSLRAFVAEDTYNLSCCIWFPSPIPQLMSGHHFLYTFIKHFDLTKMQREQIVYHLFYKQQRIKNKIRPANLTSK